MPDVFTKAKRIDVMSRIRPRGKGAWFLNAPW